MANLIFITNNPLMEKNYGAFTEKVDGGLFEVLIRVRDYIHKGHSLLMHPTSGSVKPNETLYKSLLITKSSLTGEIDFKSLELVENAIAVYNKLNYTNYQYTEKILADFQLIDLELAKSAMGRLHTFSIHRNT